MARKHGQKDSNIHVHLHGKTSAMAPDNQENMKELVSQVREVVPSFSNHEIALVLQFYDNNVATAIAAFTEDGAAAALKEWNYHGKKPMKANNKKKKKPPQKQQGDESNDIIANETIGSPEILTNQIDERHDSAASPDSSLPRPREPSPSISGSENTEDDTPASTKGISDLVPESEPIIVISQSRQSFSEEHSHMDDHKLTNSHTHKRAKSGGSSGKRSRGPSESKELPDHPIRHSNSTSSNTSYLGGKGLEKSMKDLNRQTISLQRTQNLLTEEIDNSFKRLKSVFNEIHQLLNDREVQLMSELDKVKKDSGELLKKRQQMASRLKLRVDRAQVMSDLELAELRGDIKHFVSERKMDEELGRTTRFLRNSDKLVLEIKNFGEVAPVKNLYTVRRPPSPSSQLSVESNNSTTKMDTSNEEVLQHQSNSMPNSDDVEPVKSLTVMPTPANFEVSGPGSSMVISSSSLTLSELADLHISLKETLKAQGVPVHDTSFSSTFPRTNRPQSNRPAQSGRYRNQNTNNQSYVNWKRPNQPRQNSYHNMDGDRQTFRGRGHGPRTRMEEHGPRPRIDEHGPRPRLDDHGPRPRVDDHGPRQRIDEHGPHPRLDEHGSRARIDEHGPRSRIDEHGSRPRNDEHRPRSRIDEHGPRPRIDEHTPRPRLEDHGQRPRLDDHGDSNNVDSEQKRSLGKRPVRPRNNASQSNTSQYDNKRQNTEHFNGICVEENHRKQNSSRELNINRTSIVSNEGALPQRKPRPHFDKTLEHSNSKQLMNGINHEINGLSNMQNRA